MNPDTKKLMNEIDSLKKEIQKLGSASSIPFNVAGAFRTRLLGGVTTLSTSSKSATSENKTVNEGGAATYSVMDKPDGFLEVVVDKTTYYIPIFT